MKNLTIIAILLTTVSVLNAQTTKIDSLENLLQRHTNEDTIKVNLLLNIGTGILNTMPDSAIKFAKEANTIANNLNYKKGMIQSNHIIGSSYYYKSTYDSTILYFQKCLHISLEAGDLKQISKYYNNIGLMYFNKGDNKSAINYYNKALEISPTINNERGLSFLYNNIGMVYERLAENQRALEYYQKSLKIKEELNLKKSTPALYNNIGIIYKSLKNYPKALEYFQKALSLNREVNNPNEILTNLNNIAFIYSLLKDYEKSLNLYSQIIETKGIDGKDKHLCKPYMSMADIYFIKKDYKKAIEYNNKSLIIAIDIGLIDDQSVIYEQLSKNYFAIENYKKAYQNYFKFKELSDSIFNKESIIQLTQVEAEYNYEKEKQAEKLIQQKKDADAAKQLKYHKTIINVFVVGLFVTIFIIILFYRIVRIKKKANKLLHKNNQEISEHKDLIFEQKNSLEQAKRQLQKSNEELEQIVEKRTSKLNKTITELDRFVYSASHDLSAPLKSILGLVNIATIENKNIRMQEYLDFIQRSILKLEDVIRNLVQYSRNSRLIIKKENVLLKQIINETIVGLKFLKGFEKITMSVDVSSDLSYKSDRLRLKIILSNLIGNAIKYADFNKSKPTITISTYEDNRNWFLEISDNGLGIRKEHLDKIFKMFFRATDISEGSGLGLFIVHETVHKLRGSISVESSFGEESVFILRFPN